MPRIIEEPRQQTILNDDSFVIDHLARGTHRTTLADLKASLVDDTLTESGSFADAKIVGDLLATKVDKTAGMGLSSNDYTDTEKEKLEGIESGAQENVIESISVSGVAQTIINKNVDLIFTMKTSELINDANFASDADYVHTDNNYTTTEKDKLSGIESGAQVNIIESISINGTPQAIVDKNVNIPIDTSRAPLDSPAFTGVPTAPTATSGDSSTQIATTAFVSSAISTSSYSKSEVDEMIDEVISGNTKDIGTLLELTTGTSTETRLWTPKTIHDYVTDAVVPISFLGKTESTYVTTGTVSTIPIGIQGFDDTYMLLVDVNGLDLIQGADYTINGTNIILSSPITTVGTKVHFTALRMISATVGTLELIKGDKGDTGDPAGFGEITATIDSNVGIPSVTITPSGPDTAKNLAFAFHNMKGEQGNAAGFNEITATVDSGIGTPSVSVNTSGPDTAKNIEFEFSNLKGLKGDTGDAAGFGEVTATVSSTVGTPSVTVTSSGSDTAKNFAFAFSNLKGDTGPAAGFGEVSATVGSNIGTPSVSVSTSGPDTAKDITFEFDNLKGIKGDTGDAAGFGEITASVDSGSGTPSVTVSSSGPDTAKSFDFQFSNMKGDTGDAAGFGTVTANVDSNIGTPGVTVTTSGSDTAKNFTFNFTNLKGQKGDKGDKGDRGTDGASVVSYTTGLTSGIEIGTLTVNGEDFVFYTPYPVWG